MAKKFTEANTFVPVLSVYQKKCLMAFLIRNKNAFEACQEKLTEKHFGTFDAAYSIIWTITKQLYSQNQELPDPAIIRAEMEAAFDSNLYGVTESEKEMANAFLDWAFDPKTFINPPETSKSAERFCYEKVRVFADETFIAQAKNLTGSQGMIVSDLPDVLARISEEAASFKDMQSPEIQLAFSPGWQTNIKTDVFSTGIEFIDPYMGGGHSAGEVYSLMGPYGSCKTTLAIMLCVNAASLFFTQKMADPDSRHKLAFLVSYETPIKDMRKRVLSYKAKILSDSFAEIPDNNVDLSDSNLSRMGNLKPYEKRLFQHDLRNGRPVMGELERITDAVERLNPHFVNLDMTGAFRNMGNGGVGEIARTIAHECKQRNAECGLVVIDYAKVLVTRYMAAKNLDNRELRFQLGGLAMEVKNKISIPFRAPSWVLQQFSGEANGYGPAVLADHTNSSEAKNFAENMDFSFSVSRQDVVHHACLIGCTKARRKEQMPNRIIQIDGSFAQVVAADDRFRLTPNSRRIIAKDDVDGSFVNSSGRSAVTRDTARDAADIASAVNANLTRR